MREIAEIINKLYSPEAAPNPKLIDQRCREAPFAYHMNDQNIEETHIMTYVNLEKNNYLGADISEKQDDILAKVLYKKLPKNTGMAKLFTERTSQEIGNG